MIDEHYILDYFSKQLNERMKELGIKIWYMAYYCEIEEYVLRKCLRKERLPNPWNLILMAEVLNCTVNDLLGYEHFRKTNKTPASGICMAQKHIIHHISSEIINRMNELGMSYEDLSEIADISVGTIKSWISPNASSFSKKSTFTILRICDALDCTPSDLLGY